MKVLHVIDYLSKEGGAERHLAQVAQYLAGRGVQQRVVQLYEDATSNEPDFALCGVAVERLKLRHSLLRLPAAFSPLLQAAREFCPDVLTTQMGMSDIVGRLAARRLGLPSVSTWQNTTYDTVTSADKPLRVRAAKLVARALERLSAGREARFIGVSKSVRDSYCRAIFVAPELCRVIGNSVDLGRFADLTRRAQAGPLRLVNVGRHIPNKGLDTLIEALALLPRDLEVVVEQFGTGPLTGSLQDLARRRGVEARIHWRGHEVEIPRFLAQADAFVLPSRREGLSLAYLEALACGLPVIASDIPSNKEVDPNGAASLFFQEGRPRALADRIEALGRDPALRRRLAGETRAVVEPYTIDAIGRRNYEFLLELATTKTARTKA